MSKYQQWHKVDAVHGKFLRTKCGRDYTTAMCDKRANEDECEGPVCCICRGVKKAAGR